MKLFIIRHGDPDYAHDTLTERGWQEAELLRDRLLKEKITKVYLSPLGRAQATAKPFLDASGLVPDTRDFLREFPRRINQKLEKYGIPDRASCPWDMEPALFMENQRLFSDAERWREHPIYQEDGAAEYIETVFRSFDALLEENGLTRRGILYAPDPTLDAETLERTNIAIFCHMGLGSLLLAHLANMAPPLFWQMFRVMPTSVSTILFQRRDDGSVQSKIFSVGDTTHLSPIGLTYRG